MTVTGASLARGRSKQDYATPRSFIASVQARFGPIVWDLAAHADNSVVQEGRYYGPGSPVAEDSLTRPWAEGLPTGNLWLNPPFENIKPWAAKCARESRERFGLILFLVPASIGAEWYREYVHSHAFVLALGSRLSFDGKHPFPKDLILAVYGYELRGFDTWDWRPANGGAR